MANGNAHDKSSGSTDDLRADDMPVRKDLANPPFNMSDWGGENLRQDVRYFSLSASNEIPRSRERERMSAGQVRVVGKKQFNAERAGVGEKVVPPRPHTTALREIGTGFERSAAVSAEDQPQQLRIQDVVGKFYRAFTSGPAAAGRGRHSRAPGNWKTKIPPTKPAGLRVASPKSERSPKSEIRKKLGQQAEKSAPGTMAEQKLSGFGLLSDFRIIGKFGPRGNAALPDFNLHCPA